MEAMKRNYNPLSLLQVVSPVLSVVCICFYGLPALNSLQVVIYWFDWFRVVLQKLFFIFLIVTLLVALIYFLHNMYNEQKQLPLDLYDRYAAVAPTVDRPWRDGYSNVSEARDIDDYGYRTNPNYNDVETTVEAVRESTSSYDRVAVEAVRESSDSYDRVAVEVISAKSYKRTKTGKKSTTVEYRRMESEKVMKTAPLKSQKTTMAESSSEQFRLKMETFITEKKRMFNQHYGIAEHGPPQWRNGVIDQWYNGVADPWQNGVADQWRNGVADQRRNGVADQWRNGVPQWQNGAPQLENGVPRWQNGAHQLENGVPQWQNGAPQLQNGVHDHDQRQNGIVQWQEPPRDDKASRHRSRRSRKGSASTRPVRT